MSDPQPGRYRHYKGNEYTVLGLVRHSETEDELVLYRQEYGDHSLWVRPKDMFLETVKSDGRDIPRFQYLGAEQANESKAGNLFSSIPANLPEELLETILITPHVSVERIVFYGHYSPDGYWYDHYVHESVVV